MKQEYGVGLVAQGFKGTLVLDLLLKHQETGMLDQCR
jgi:hypothetical protein